MREVTREMIRTFRIKKLGYDFMGYTFKKSDDLSFHHLLVAKKDCKELGLGTGYVFWNGAILVMRTSHEYLHAIERTDRDVFIDITNEMLDININRKIAIENLKRIRSMLLSFEKEHCSTLNSKGQHIIKPEYVEKRTKL